MKKNFIKNLIINALNEALQLQLYQVEYKVFKHGDLVLDAKQQFNVKSESEIINKIKELSAETGMTEPDYNFVIVKKTKVAPNMMEGELNPTKNKLNVYVMKPGTDIKIKLKYDFISSSDKKTNKATEVIKKVFPDVSTIGKSFSDELEIVRQEIQRGKLSNDNMFLYPTKENGKTIYNATRDINQAKSNSLKFQK